MVFMKLDPESALSVQLSSPRPLQHIPYGAVGRTTPFRVSPWIYSHEANTVTMSNKTIGLILNMVLIRANELVQMLIRAEKNLITKRKPRKAVKEKGLGRNPTRQRLRV